ADAGDHMISYGYLKADGIPEISGLVSNEQRRLKPGGPQVVVAQYEYDVRGNLIKSTDAKGSSVLYGYDELGRKKSMTIPDPNGTGDLGDLVTTYTWTDTELKTITEPGNDLVKSVKTVNDYDAVGHVTKTTKFTNSTTSNEFDAMGNLTSTVD